MNYYTVDRRILLFFVYFWTILPTLAQRIMNIRPVARQDTIVLTYDLVGAQPGQQFKIKAYYHNGYGDFREMKALEEVRRGGTIVAGGTHQLTWRVLEDAPNGLASDSVRFTLIATLPEGPNLTLADRKALLYAEMTRTTDRYLEQLYNQKVLLEHFRMKPFESNWVYGELSKNREKFNNAYENLLEKHRDFELSVETLWGNNAKEETRNFFNKVLTLGISGTSGTAGTSEHQSLLDLNKKILMDMNTFVHGSHKSKKSLVKTIQDAIDKVTTDPDRERGDLRKETEELYKKLCP